MVWRITTRIHQHCSVSTGRIFSHSRIQSSPAWTLGSHSWRRQWPTPRPSSLGQRKPICLPWATTPFGGECLGVKVGNEMLHFLPHQCHLWWCGPARRIPDRPARDNCSWEHPANVHQLPCWGSCHRGSNTAWKSCWGGSSPYWEASEGPSTSQTPSEGPTRREHLPIWFPGWREVLHPSRPVTATGQVPPIPGSPDRDLIARVLGEGGPSTNRWRNSCRSKIQGQSPCHQLGCWKPHSKRHHLWASEE